MQWNEIYVKEMKYKMLTKCVKSTCGTSKYSCTHQA